ncbi:MAG: hypothetical protein H0X40_00515 [Chthoniobacterales bacterium]|nr:hypothetical protein [Chthoniobacterales bacterium]
MDSSPSSRKLYLGKQRIVRPPAKSSGCFVEIFGDTFYRIENYDQIPPFFISVVSDADHWLFVSTTGGLSAGRISPDHALFPYYTVDRIHENAGNTGPFTVLQVPNELPRMRSTGQAFKRTLFWQPFQQNAPNVYKATRDLYKNASGNKIVFAETNHDLGLTFRYSWVPSERFGFVRESTLENLTAAPREIMVLDGLLNLLPAGADRRLQLEFSYLVDAYKANELVPGTRLALFTLAAGIVDEAIPMESLGATSVWSDGFAEARVLLAEPLVRAAARGEAVEPAARTRGLRGAYVLHGTLQLAPNELQSWRIVADVEQTQQKVAALRERLRQPEMLRAALEEDVRAGQERLVRLVAGADGLQKTADQLTSVHHFTNTLFNGMRGGVFAEGNRIAAADFAKFVGTCNREVAARHSDLLGQLPAILREEELRARVEQTGDRDLLRIFYEYLPITFSRRHGDPSRPWNKFAIKLKDDAGAPLLNFEGNWRDIFQNWEALSFSCPAFLEHMIAKFVNASTLDGYNPYRITRGGIEWEEPDSEDPWASIGYWGDHQIIYLLKLLEASAQFHPGRLTSFLSQEIFVYADVPYRIASYERMLVDPRATIDFDEERSRLTKMRAEKIGADGKLRTQADGSILHVNLAEKLLVPLLAKLTNFIPSGGIWMNTQRPEWNDANNALVGSGVSVVTLNYLRRYLTFCLDLFARAEAENFAISEPVAQLLASVGESLGKSEAPPREIVDRLSGAGSEFREKIYADAPNELQRMRSTGQGFKRTLAVSELRTFLETARDAVDRSLRANLRPDGLFHAYNLLSIRDRDINLEHLPEMLEGQVAALSSGLLSAEEALKLLRALRRSALYRKDARSYLLYPNRALPSFLEKNIIPENELARCPLLQRMLAEGDERLVYRDAAGQARFGNAFVNARSLGKELDRLVPAEEREVVLALYELVFQHHSFTGRSGAMFAFEGLGSIYWHMVAKLLLATQECFFAALDAAKPARIVAGLGAAYYEIRDGLGFNKTPNEYGAFPTDPYSHSPAHAGAQQPGMTGQVKEEVLTRLGELGVRVRDGIIRFQPALLRPSEFLRAPSEFSYFALDGQRRTIALPNDSLAFTFCQTPIVYRLAEEAAGLELSPAASRALVRREIREEEIFVSVPRALLFSK